MLFFVFLLPVAKPAGNIPVFERRVSSNDLSLFLLQERDAARMVWGGRRVDLPWRLPSDPTDATAGGKESKVIILEGGHRGEVGPRRA